jgi:hypothetical protein
MIVGEQLQKRLINHNRQDAQIEKNLQEDELLSNKFQNTIVINGHRAHMTVTLPIVS